MKIEESWVFGGKAKCPKVFRGGLIAPGGVDCTEKEASTVHMETLVSCVAAPWTTESQSLNNTSDPTEENSQ